VLTTVSVNPGCELHGPLTLVKRQGRDGLRQDRAIPR